MKAKAKPKGEDSGKPQPEYIEGPEAFQRFDALMTTLVAVPRSVIEQREEEYRRTVAANPKKRGPKPRKTIPKTI